MIMLERRYLRTLLLIAVAIYIIYAVFGGGHGGSNTISRIIPFGIDQDDFSDVIPRPDSSGFRSPARRVSNRPVVDAVDRTGNHLPPDDRQRVIFSHTSKDMRYYQVDLAGVDAFNPNIIPHPSRKNRWIVVAQAAEYRDDIGMSEQIACIAEFKNGVLHCPRAPLALPIANSILGDCTGEWAYTNMRRGPRDARVFNGPDQPYIMYGSQSHLPGMCLGLWIQNLWMLLPGAKHPDEGFARSLTELGRPEPYHQLQKNFFLFWDNSSRILAHYDIWPKRVFSLVRPDGSAASALLQSNGLDLAQFSYEQDQACMEKLFPKITHNATQSIHQGTNSLSITMCKRADRSCVITNENTFILHIMQHKNFFEAQGIYEPYPILFARHEPYNIHAVATKPLWYFGKGPLTNATGSRVYLDRPSWPMPTNHSVMTYTTSISWKDQSQMYHGYLDDTLFLSFGIEDTRSGAIDVLASDILQDLSFC